MERFFECSKEWRQILKLTESPSEQPNMYMNNNNNMWKRKHDRGNKWYHTSSFCLFILLFLLLRERQRQSLKRLCELIVQQWQSTLTLDAYEIWFLSENTLNTTCIKYIDSDENQILDIPLSWKYFNNFTKTLFFSYSLTLQVFSTNWYNFNKDLTSTQGIQT